MEERELDRVEVYDEAEEEDGVFFSRSAMLKIADFANILSWIALLVYLAQFGAILWAEALGGTLFSGVVGTINFLARLTIPFQGVFYFLVLRAIAVAIEAIVEIENNTRRKRASGD
ncbi:MAG: hypothetical protein GX495_08480 [Chloroflexi bacterium]|jgi:uncharacterized membrane protein YfbV (UPF0208 family)|nr:hypothetical protein [Chloroflexota bacterium]